MAWIKTFEENEAGTRTARLGLSGGAVDAGQSPQYC